MHFPGVYGKYLVGGWDDAVDLLVAPRIRYVHWHHRGTMTKKAKTIKPGKVEKIIQSPVPDEPEKAQIAIDGADDLYREIRIENTLTDEQGQEVQLKQDADVKITVEAEPEATTTKTKRKSASKS